VRLSNFLKPEHVFLNLEVVSRDDLMSQVTQRLGSVGTIRHPETVAELLLDRERLGSTVVDEEAAIPHCKVPGLKSIVAAFARTATPVPFGEASARLFFFVLSPREQPAAHLQVLAGIARLLRNPQAREACRQAESGEDLLAALTRLDPGNSS